ncbi:MAG: right-handed parallel beta-helix repeat-containing protein [Phycisphaerae bacterium]
MKAPIRTTPIAIVLLALAPACAAVAAQELLVSLAPAARASTGPASGPSSGPATSSAPAVKDNRPVFKVKNGEEFLGALGPDRIIRLKGREYNLGGMKQRKLTYARWFRNGDGYELMLRNLRNVRIEGVGSPAILVSKGQYPYVLRMEDCEGVELVNMELGRLGNQLADDSVVVPVMREDSSGVLRMKKCRDIAMRDCTLHGGPLAGLELVDVIGFEMVGSTIKQSNVLLSAVGCDKLSFNDCAFTDNGTGADEPPQYAFDIQDSENVEFKDCRIRDNRVAESLFQVVSSSNVVIKGGRITVNVFKKLSEPDDALTTDNVVVSENTPPPEDEPEMPFEPEMPPNLPLPMGD